MTNRVDKRNSAEFGIKEKVVSNIGTQILRVTQHFSTSHSYFLPYKCLSANLLLSSKSRIKLGLPGEAESRGPNGELSSRVLPKAGWARKQYRVGYWWPPPFWGTQIVIIFGVTEASKGGALYLESQALQVVGEVWTVGAEGCCGALMIFPATFLGPL